MVWVLVETKGHKFFEKLRKLSLQFRCLVFGDEEEDPHWMDICIWRLSIGQFYGCDAQ